MRRVFGSLVTQDSGHELSGRRRRRGTYRDGSSLAPFRHRAFGPVDCYRRFEDRRLDAERGRPDDGLREGAAERKVCRWLAPTQWY
jgi:hypothetical protein